jgi:CubicO group peptidase (beta-lactamase class C family)
MKFAEALKIPAVAVLALLAAAHVLAQAVRDPLAGLDASVTAAMQRWEVPGLAVAVVKDQKLVLARGFGVRDVTTREPVDADTLFGIGSNTKAFTATALGLLVKEGRLGWDDPVLRYLPEFQMYDPQVTRKITIRDLLCHRGGLGTFAGDLMSFGSVYDRAEIIRRIRFIEPAYDFRAGFGYSNLMFLVAGEIIPKASGASWDGFIRQRFFTPLGMSRSSTTVGELLAASNVAAPHGLRDGKVVPIPHDTIDNIAPAGAINSSANDMARWLLLQTGNGSYNGQQIVDPAVISETRTLHNALPVGEAARKMNPWTHFSGYGLGWGLSDYRGRLLVSHTGGLNGMISIVAVLPEENFGVVVLTNYDTHPLTRSVANTILDAYLGAEDQGWDQRYAAVVQNLRDRRDLERKAREGAHVANTRPSLPLEAYVGHYTSAVFGEAQVTLEGGVLKLSPTPHPGITGRLDHWQLDTFLCSWSDAVWDSSLVYFELDDTGKVAQLRFTVRPEWLDTMEYVFKRDR